MLLVNFFQENQTIIIYKELKIRNDLLQIKNDLFKCTTPFTNKELKNKELNDLLQIKN